MISTGVRLLPDHWDKNTSQVIGRADKQSLNVYIVQRKVEIDRIIQELTVSREIGKYSAVALKNYIQSRLCPDKEDDINMFAKYFLKVADTKSQSTHGVYMQTYRRMQAFTNNLDKLTFEDIDRSWLSSFNRFMEITAPSANARNIHFRNIRAVFNSAIDDGITTLYPFRKFKITPVKTAKRSLSVEQVRMLFNYPVEEYLVKYVDMFKLIIYLVGINIIDLCHLKEIRDGRIEYHRAKTHRLYSIKIEPEAQEIIDKYRGEKYLLNPLDTYESHNDYAKHLNMALKRVGEVDIWSAKRKDGKSYHKKIYNGLFPNITTYWARHTWATLASKLEIPKETIAAALGHGENTVTDIYIDFEQQKIDEANRKVIDYILGKI